MISGDNCVAERHRRWEGGKPGWPTDMATRRSTRFGSEAAMRHASAAPQSWPTRENLWRLKYRKALHRLAHVQGLSCKPDLEFKGRS